MKTKNSLLAIIFGLTFFSCQKVNCDTQPDENQPTPNAKVVVEPGHSEIFTSKVLAAIAENVKEQFGTDAFSVKALGTPESIDGLVMYRVEYKTKDGEIGTAILVNE